MNISRRNQQPIGRIPKDENRVNLELTPLEKRLELEKQDSRINRLRDFRDSTIINLGRATRYVINSVDPELAKPTANKRINTIAGRRTLVGLTMAGLAVAGTVGLTETFDHEPENCVTIGVEDLPGDTPAKDASIYSGYFAELPGNSAYDNSLQGFVTDGEFTECGEGINYLPQDLLDRINDQ